MTAALIIDITLWGSVLALGFMAFRRGRVIVISAAREGTMDFINIVPRIALGVIGSGYIAAVIPAEVITGWLGPNSGWLGVLTAVIAGAATPGGPVVGFSIGAVALKVGGGPPQVIAYVVAWALFAFQRRSCGKSRSCRPNSSGSAPRFRCRFRFWRRRLRWRSGNREAGRTGFQAIDRKSFFHLNDTEEQTVFWTAKEPRFW